MLVWLALAAVACNSAPQNPGTSGSDLHTGTTVSQQESSRNRDAAAGQPRVGGHITVAIAEETNSFTPFSGEWSVSAYIIANAIYDPLVAMDRQGIAKPYLAESITPTGDLKRWTITMRPKITFQNGEPLDARAVKKNLDAAKTAPLTGQALTAIDSVELVDDRSVAVNMNRPWATFPSSLAIQIGYMAAPAMLDDPAGATAKPIGTGPFEFQDRQTDDFLKVRRNPNYWRTDAANQKLPYLEAVDFKIITDSTASATAFQAGDINAFLALTPPALTAGQGYVRNGKAQIITNATAETDETVIAFNTTKPPFDDLLARQIMAYGIDQTALSNDAYSGVQPPAWGMFEEGSPYYISRQEAGYPDHDPNKAKALAAEYEKKHGKPLQFTLLGGTSPPELLELQAVQSQAKDFGVTIDVAGIESSTQINRVIVTGDYQATLFPMWSAPTPDQGYIFLALPPNPGGISLNYTRYDDAEVRAAMDEFRATIDPKTRIDSFKKVQQALAQHLQVVFSVHSRQGFIYENDLFGFWATTFPSTEIPAFVPYPNSPFLTSVWRGDPKP